jgi:hypothetical protein
MDESSHRPTPPRALDPALGWAFLQRTALSIVVTASLVALAVAVYVSINVGARYLFFALWALTFFSTTALIFRHLLFNRNPIRGFLAIAVKMAALVAVYVVLWSWPVVPGEQEKAHMIAIVAGVTTPLLVFLLRVGGWAMEQKKREKTSKPQASDRGGSSDRSPRVRFQAQS